MEVNGGGVVGEMKDGKICEVGMEEVKWKEKKGRGSGGEERGRGGREGRDREREKQVPWSWSFISFEEPCVGTENQPWAP